MFVLCGDKMWLFIHLLAKEMNFVDFGKNISLKLAFSRQFVCQFHEIPFCVLC